MSAPLNTAANEAVARMLISQARDAGEILGEEPQAFTMTALIIAAALHIVDTVATDDLQTAIEATSAFLADYVLIDADQRASQPQEPLQ